MNPVLRILCLVAAVVLLFPGLGCVGLGVMTMRHASWPALLWAAFNVLVGIACLVGAGTMWRNSVRK
jgi:hypothetical protein